VLDQADYTANFSVNSTLTRSIISCLCCKILSNKLLRPVGPLQLRVATAQRAAAALAGIGLLPTVPSTDLRSRLPKCRPTCTHF